ncbi:NYN domain-containing protein, partial [Streptomyces violarus]|nr:NYN domain-containing protein [Streptomyces violarus]
MSTDVKRVTTVLTALLLAALTSTASPAAARAADDAGPSAGQRIAGALRTSPVYVDEAYADAVPPSRQRQLAQQIRRTGLPIKVVLTPLTKGDAFDGDSDVLAGTVRDRLPDQRELVLITTDGDFADSLDGYEWPADTHQTRDAVAAVGFLDETRDAGLADLTGKAVELVAEGRGTERYEEAIKDLDGSTAPSATPDPDDSAATSAASYSGGSAWWLLVGVPVLALAAALAA